MKIPPFVALDTETDLICAETVTPRLVCATFAEWPDDAAPARIETPDEIPMDVELLKHDDPRLESYLTALLENEEIHLVGAKIDYDMGVFVNEFPRLMPLIWKAYYAGRIHDVVLMEKLRHISTVGDIEYMSLPDGSRMKRVFSLGELSSQYLGVDRSAAKKGKDSWRLRYGELRDVPLDAWPIEATRYACDDGLDTGRLFVILQDLRTEHGPGSMNTEGFQAAAAFALWLATAWGLATDQERVDRLERALDEILNPARMEPLYAAGLLTPAEPGRPKKDGSTTKPKAEKKNMEALRAFVADRCARHLLQVKETPTGKIGTDADIFKQLAEAGEPLAQLFEEREHHIKLKTQFLPVLRSPVVRFCFNPLVTTGRTSSYGEEHFPSTNGQNQPRIGGDFSIRECFVARPGCVLVSCDYHMIELCAVAQQVYSLFGSSTHRDLINAGVDLHAYLGAQIAAELDPDFGRLVRDGGLDRDGAYKAFLACKKSPDEKTRKWFKHYRTFAKPTGLGYPGGLGPDTFVVYARATYDVRVDRDTADRLREIWRRTHPDMRRYFDWIQTQPDAGNVGCLAYSTPMGMYRGGCSYTEMANGCAMQSRTAEGAKRAMLEVTRAMYDETQGSILFGCRAPNFIHDEILAEIPLDERTHERAKEIERIMVESMRPVMPDVVVRAEPCLMTRWYKEAEPVFDAHGRLIPWEPKQ